MFVTTLLAKLKTISLLLVLCLPLAGCLGTVVATTVDVAIETAKVPFKVGGAVIDVVTDDDGEEDEDD